MLSINPVAFLEIQNLILNMIHNFRDEVSEAAELQTEHDAASAAAAAATCLHPAAGLRPGFICNLAL